MRNTLAVAIVDAHLLADVRHQGCGINLESTRQALDRLDCGVATPRLTATHVCAIEACDVRKLFLRQAALLAKRAQASSKGRAAWVRRGLLHA